MTIYLYFISDHLSWLSRLGYNLKSLAPQLFPDDLPGGSVLPPITRQPTIWGSYKDAWSLQLPSLLSNLPAINVESGFVSFLSLRKMSDAKSLSAPPRSALKTNVMDLVPKKIGAASDPPFGKGILVSRNPHGQAIVSSVPAANAIYRDVYTSVFNSSSMLPFTFVVHSAQQDAFYFVKEETWRASEDKQQLKRMQGQVNTTFHEISKENGSGNNYLDVKIHGSNAVINLRYGTTAEKEKQRLLHHARLSAVRKAWHREKEFMRNGFSGSIEWSTSEIDEIQKQGSASNYECEYVHDIQTYPELAEDPFNIQFIKKQPDKSKRRRRKRQSKDREKSLPFEINEIESDC